MKSSEEFKKGKGVAIKDNRKEMER